MAKEVQPAAVQKELPPAAAPVTAAPSPRVFTVEIPLCLLGKRTFIAADAADAYAKYKTFGGITTTSHPELVEELAAGSKGYTEFMEAKAKAEAEATAAAK